MRRLLTVVVGVGILEVATIYAQTPPTPQPPQSIPSTVTTPQIAPTPAPATTTNPPPPAQPVAQPTPTPAPATNPSAVELGTLQMRFQKALDENRQQIEKLQRQISQLRTTAGDSVTTQIQQLQSRIDLLEQLNQQRQQSSKKLDQIRFETGKGILNVLVEKSSTLQVASGLGSVLSGFQRTLNPMSDAGFVTEVTRLTSNLRDGNDSVLSAANTSGLLANPYVSLAMTVVSVFTSRSKPADKLSQMTNVVCVADFTSKTTADFQFIDNSIKTLDERVRAFNATTRKDRFKNYAATVAYDHTWDEYQKDKQAAGDDPVTTLTNAFFAALPAPSPTGDSSTPGLSRLRYQVENVKTYVAEYESLVRQADDFYASFAAIVDKDAELAPANNTLCAGNPSIARAHADLKALLPRVTAAKIDFEAAYLTSIPPESRRVLFSAE